MDQLKKQLQVIKKYSFWIMCVVVLGLSVTCWYLATSELNKQTTENASSIKTQVSALDSVRSKSPHPNDSTIKGMNSLTSVVADDVVKGWDELANGQEKVLKWPETFDKDFQDAVRGLRPIELAVSVSAAGEKLSEGLSAGNRKLYQTFIQFELEKNLAKTIGATWKASAQNISRGSGAAGMPGGGPPGGLSMPSSGGAGGSTPSLDSGMPVAGGMGGVAGRPNPDDRALVLWKGDNQQEIVSTHFGFIADTDAPTTLQILYAQEDLWVLQNILGIIKRSNIDASARHEAAIKVIESISIGRTATALNGKITSLGGDAPGGAGGLLGAGGPPGLGGGPPGMGGGPPGMGGGPPGMGGGPGGAAGGGAGAVQPGAQGGLAGPAKAAGSDLADFRYVDRDYKPLLGSRLRDAMLGKATNKDDVLLAVAKRMPVRLKLVIDQTKLNVILAECANSPLPIEVRQVRIGKTDDTAGGGIGGMGGGMLGGGGARGGGPPGGMSSMPSLPGGGGASGGGAGGPGYGLGGGGSGPEVGPPGGGGFGLPGGMPGAGSAGGNTRSSTVSSSQTDPSEVKVEIYGIVYIYNPVNRKLLNIDAAAAGAPGTTAGGAAPAGNSTTQVAPVAGQNVVATK